MFPFLFFLYLTLQIFQFIYTKGSTYKIVRHEQKSKYELKKDHCGISQILSLIGGRWKINILVYLLNENKLRYNELRKRLVGVSERMLTSKLKELEKDGSITRIVFPEAPPKVEYELTELEKSLEEILNKMEKWGETNLPLK